MFLQSACCSCVIQYIIKHAGNRRLPQHASVQWGEEGASPLALPFTAVRTTTNSGAATDGEPASIKHGTGKRTSAGGTCVQLRVGWTLNGSGDLTVFYGAAVDSIQITVRFTCRRDVLFCRSRLNHNLKVNRRPWRRESVVASVRLRPVRCVPGWGSAAGHHGGL